LIPDRRGSQADHVAARRSTGRTPVAEDEQASAGHLDVVDFSQAGWTGYPPFSELAYQPTTGVDYWIWSIQLSGLGTLLTGVNFMATILKMRAPGMTLMRMPVFVWATLVTCVLIILAFPVITVTLALLGLDRYLGMHFFTNAMGGNMTSSAARCGSCSSCTCA